MRVTWEFQVALIFHLHTTEESNVIRDGLFNIQWRYVKQVCQQWLDSLDRVGFKIPAQVVMASAILFLLQCERFKLNPREVLDIADLVIRKSYDLDPRYVRGIRQYLKEELKDG